MIQGPPTIPMTSLILSVSGMRTFEYSHPLMSVTWSQLVHYLLYFLTQVTGNLQTLSFWVGFSPQSFQKGYFLYSFTSGLSTFNNRSVYFSPISEIPIPCMYDYQILSFWVVTVYYFYPETDYPYVKFFVCVCSTEKKDSDLNGFLDTPDIQDKEDMDFLMTSFYDFRVYFHSPDPFFYIMLFCFSQ